MKTSTKTLLATAVLTAIITGGVTYGTTKAMIRTRCRKIVARDCGKLLPKQREFCEEKAKEICDV